MSYYVLKHSAKGTTWGEHKYIRKEGNRYIYPEDVKKNANDNIEKQKELNEENTENDTRYEKALNDYLKTISKDLNVYTITEYEHDRLYENDPKYKELSDLFDEEYYRTSKAKSDAKMEKQDYINKASENKRNRILSEARDAVTKVKNEKAEKARIEKEKRKETAKYMAKSAEKVEKRLAHPLETLHDPKAVKERSRLQGIHAYKTSINRGTNKERDYDPTKPNMLARKRKLMRERNRRVYTIDAGPVHYRSGDPLKVNPYTPKEKVTIKKKKYLKHSVLHGTYILIKN